MGSITDTEAYGLDTSRGFNLAAITINGGAQSNLIGGAAQGEANYIVGNRGGQLQGQPGRGLEIVGTGTDLNLVQGNIFGQTPTGEYRYNLGDGVVLDLGASRNIIGGVGFGKRNKIMNCFGAGVAIRSTNGSVCNANKIENNQLGGFAQAEGNELAGVTIGPKATANTIGGTAAGAGNLVVGNGAGDLVNGGGIVLIGTTGNFIYGNFIGVDENNTARRNARGIHLYGCTEPFIGNSTKFGGNTIGANENEGILLTDTVGAKIYGNRIGITASGQDGIPNLGSGIVLKGASNNNRIGAVEAGFGNNIQTNVDNGIRIEGTSTGNSIRGNNHGFNANLIGIDLVAAGDYPDGTTDNDADDADTGPNGLQNSPKVVDIDVTNGVTKLTVEFKGLKREGSGSFFGAPPQYVFDLHANGAYIGSVPFQSDKDGNPVARGAAANVVGTGRYTITVRKNLAGKALQASVTPITVAFIATIEGSTSELSNYAIDPTN